MNAQEFKNHMVQFAIQGKLIPQNPNDTSIDLLINKINEEKDELINIKNAKKNKDSAIIFKKDNHYFEQIGEKEPICIDKEIPFIIPDTWVWFRLDDIGVYKKGPFGSALKKSIFVPKSENSVKVYEQKNAIQKDYSLGDYYITKEYYNAKMKGFTVEPGDIIVSCAGTIGETYVMPNEIELGIINQALMRMNIVPSINLDYFLIYFDHILKKSAIEHSKGSAIKNIPPFKIFKKLLFPLPPIEEQSRIVDILKKVDNYVELNQQLSILNKSFVSEFKKVILQEAVQGKLVSQDTNDEPASVLLTKIKQEKEQLIKAKKIKRKNKESVIYKEDGHYYEKIGKKGKPICIDDEIPFEIPDSWEWCKLENIIELISGRDLKKSQYNNLGNGIPYITGASNIVDDSLIINRWTDEPAVIAIKNDVLLSCKGTVGKIIVLDENEVHIARQIMAIRLINENLIDKQYIVVFLQYYVNKLINVAKSMIPGISRDDVLKINFPLPPLNEQKHIVDKIEQLFENIDVLIDE